MTWQRCLDNLFCGTYSFFFVTDPTCWSQADVARWLGHKMQELKIPAASCQPVCQWAANFEGPGFVQITEDEFKARLPQVRFLFTFISFSSSNTQFYESRIFCLFTFWVFFPDKSFELTSKYTQKCQYNLLY